MNFIFSFPYFRVSFIIHSCRNSYQCFLFLLFLFSFVFFFAFLPPWSCFPYFSRFLNPFFIHFIYLLLSDILPVLSNTEWITNYCKKKTRRKLCKTVMGQTLYRKPKEVSWWALIGQMLYYSRYYEFSYTRVLVLIRCKKKMCVY